jgi:hypothetical protein
MRDRINMRSQPAWSRGMPESAVLVIGAVTRARPCTVDEVGDDQIPHSGVGGEAESPLCWNCGTCVLPTAPQG